MFGPVVCPHTILYRCCSAMLLGTRGSLQLHDHYAPQNRKSFHIPGRGSSAHALRGSSAHAPLPGVICTRTSFFWWLGQGNLDLGVVLGDYPLGFGGWEGELGFGLGLGDYP